jgi:NodT family efflux transporter outer membrane factor (OMF) lipoprotein
MMKQAILMARASTSRAGATRLNYFRVSPLSRLAMAFSLAALLSACMEVGPDFHKPEAKVPATWLDSKKPGPKSADSRNWWKSFQDPVLDRLVERAYRQNLDVQIAAVRILEARAQLGIARGSLFPQRQQFTADLFYDQLSERSPYFQSTADYSFASFQTGFDALWEIDIWGRFRRGIESAGAQLTASALEYDDVLVTLTAEVAAAYVQIRTFQQRLVLARGNADLQEKSFRIAESQYRNGISTELDMQQAKALQRATRAEIASLEVGLRQSKNALSQLLGMPPSHLENELGEGSEIPAAASDIAAGIPADMLRRRPDVRREEFKAAAQSAQVGVAEAELLPKFSLYGSIGLASGSVGSVDAFDVFSPHALAAKFGPTVTWPILQYGRLKNNVRVQDARFQQLLIGYQSAVLRALREVEDAMIAFRKAGERVDSLREGVDASQRAAELALTQYRDGLEDYTRVLNSQLFLVQQQDKLTASRGDVARNLIAMYKALGGGWEIREGRDIVPADIKKTMKERTDWSDLLDEPAKESAQPKARNRSNDNDMIPEDL